jgi:hypothetical protein
MTISNDLFLAVLALDSYNRGYNQGLVFWEPSRDGNIHRGAAGSERRRPNEKAARGSCR